MSPPSKPAYAGKSAIRRVVQAARESGIDVAGIEVPPDGRIRVFGASELQGPAFDEVNPWDAELADGGAGRRKADLFEQLERAGKL